MALTIDNRSGAALPWGFKKAACRAIEEALKLEGVPETAEVGLSFVSDEQMAELNGQYRGKDSTTDVLSFPMWSGEELKEHIDDEELLLGDIVISVYKAVSQAAEYGHSARREAGFLAAHGALHLLGFDHMCEEDERIMREKQDTIMQNINLTR